MFSFLAPASVYDEPSAIYSFLSNPARFIARTLHSTFAYLGSPITPLTEPIRVVCISDTHTLTKDVPSGDLLIHAGDLTNAGSVAEIQAQVDWLDALPHPHKVCIAGNHDSFLDPKSRKTLSKANQDGHLNWRSLHYLQHNSITLTFPKHRNRRLNMYGAPQIPYHNEPRCAFRYQRSQDAWSGTVPIDIDILVTHTPPKWHLDLPVALGCEWLLKELWRVKPTLHVFGHIHAAHGKETVRFDREQAAYERLCSRAQQPILSLINPFVWLDLVRMISYGVKGLLWRLIWVGSEHASVLVNAALMSEKSKCLDNPPTVVEI